MKGDVLRVVRGPWAHYGISARNDNQVVIEVDLGGVVSVVHLEHFSRGFPVEVDRQAAPWEREQIVARALEKLGTPWTVHFNCESLVSYAVTGIERSWTVENVAKLLVVCGIAAFVSRPTFWAASRS